jgi:hypothetical protein
MSFIEELKRRNVFRAGIAYAVVGWLLIEVADILLPTFSAPEWVMRVFVLLIILGFPLASIFAWAFETTTYSLDDIETAISDMEQGKTLKPILIP